MKATNITTVLDEARAASTAAELDAAISKIEAARDEARGRRDQAEVELQAAIVAGRDTAKIQAAIAQAGTDVMTYEAAIAGFSHRRGDLAQAEESPNSMRSSSVPR